MIIRTYTISEKHKSFIWLPPKCATNLISWVLSYFEFSSVEVDIETNQIQKILPNQTSHFGHGTILPSNHTELDFICAIRHPYERVLSMYQHTSSLRNSFESPSVLNFEKFIDERIIKKSQGMGFSFFEFSETFKIRKPDYLIKTENLYEDLIKIPFIKDSDLKNSGILKNFCDKKINKSYNQLNPQEYLTPHIKDIIYNNSSAHFDFFGYEK
jgi:hypothetical protein